MDSTSQPVIPDFNTISFIYFDLDDTLIDHKNAQDRALLDVWSQYPQMQQIEPLEFVTEYGATNHRLWEAYRNSEVTQRELRRLRFEDTFQRLGISSVDWREIDKVYMDCYSRHWDWIPDARKAFVRISEQYPVGIMTNGFTVIQKKKFEYFSLNRYAHHLIISEEAGHLKPDTRIFNFAAEQAGCKPRELLYVGDSYSSDVTGGINSGWKTAWYNRSGMQPELNLAHFTFSEYHRLLGVLQNTNTT